MRILLRFIADEDGQGMVEYTLIISLVAMFLIFAFTAFGGAVSNNINNSSDKIGDV